MEKNPGEKQRQKEILIFFSFQITKTGILKDQKLICLHRIHPSENLPDIFGCPLNEAVERIAGGHRTATDEVYWYVTVIHSYCSLTCNSDGESWPAEILRAEIFDEELGTNRAMYQEEWQMLADWENEMQEKQMVMTDIFEIFMVSAGQAFPKKFFCILFVIYQVIDVPLCYGG